ncbi:DUF167 domain-containing protein [Patescibacteria group bacterium]|nr:MAG: DUF167 domain-containing protein [Patescibacteria group bacterium]
MILTVHARPNARETKIVSWLDNTTIKVDLNAPPEKGKANEALLRLLADEFGVAPSRLNLVRGAGTRLKQVEIPDEVYKNRPV